eukprot:NODE_4603_length_768_cov_1.115445_g4580_i0.p1 GENE.NODE_4603_length_768_cov_1.115445_g4580_i0~~NODE_4603_length_768_cov_1.115445_g4580_i0.p1  ORF type:complete len:192 (-),score=8.41 NODE_4603_length_768_cov_1.115445_g4580_i0:3-578(-)
MQGTEQFDQHPGINRAHISRKITCGMNDGIDDRQFITPWAGIVDIAPDRPCAHDGKMGGTVFASCQSKDMMPGRNQIAHDGRPDQAASAQNKNTHRNSPEFVMRSFIEPQVRVRSSGNFTENKKPGMSPAFGCLRDFVPLDRGDYATSKMPSISTATPSGRDATPTAERACLPASPKTSTMVSDAPLTTLG